ncbi:endonuclease/exonuclease/phosphatase family protein [Aestuariivivens sediminis]|uniref:endonuclease/exonuclease/phosphatase family protein n=1 Tax=Aestuariivivens sediminis TaxID=2913557 RepID=UPI001F56A4C2|nr:endonuclease/exonuclease/phosphatase family protein [Aestuariivivens sediminis]
MNRSKIKERLVILVLFLLTTGNAQEKMYIIHTIAFYNLENLFDTINDPHKLDELSPIMKMKSNKSYAFEKKIRNMARVIADIGKDIAHNAPAIIGVSEIENIAVLEALVNTPELLGKGYGIVHFDSPDARGIDVALLYQKEIFTPTHISKHELFLFDDTRRKRIHTRDQLLVSGKLNDERIHIVVNHWPSRRGGEAQSRPKREAAARLNKQIIDSLQHINPYAKICIMGDLNDNPINSSLKSVLKAKRDKNSLALKAIYNPFEKLYKRGLGTTAYQDTWSLFDQILITKPLLEKDRKSFRFYRAGIFNKNYLITQAGRYKGYPFRSFSDASFTGGYSDHFPVYIQVIKEAPSALLVVTSESN